MTRHIAVIGAAALALTLGGLPLMAQAPGGGSGQGQRMGGQGRGGRGGPGGPGAMGIFPGLNQVDLTDQQREQVRAILEQERQAGAPGAKMRDAEEGLHTALLADTPDPQTIETAKAALRTAQAAELDHRVELMQKIAAILTQAQRQQLAQMQPPAGGRRGGGH